MNDARIRKADRTSIIAASDVQIDVAKVSVTGVITTQGRDRSEDVVITSGIDLANHEANPVVLLEHELLIGHARDTTGAYTVKKFDGYATATTYFSQNIPEALQTFRLIDEGVLRGLSIGFVVRKARMITTDDHVALTLAPDGTRVPVEKFGILYEETELIEYTHTVLPDNPDALTVMVQKSRVGGEPMSPLLRRILAPYQLTTPTSVVSGFDADAAKQLNTNTTEKTAVADEYEEMPDEKEVVDDEPEVVDEEVAEDDEEDDTPPGAKLLDGVYTRLLELAQFVADAGSAKRQENPDVLAFVDEMTPQLDAMCSGVAETHRGLYPDHKALDEVEEQTADTDAGEQSDDEAKSIRKRLAGRILSYRKSRVGFAPLPTPTADAIADKAEIAKLTAQVATLENNFTKLLRQFRKAKAGR